MFADRLAQRARDRVADLVRHLRAAGRVEEDEAALQRREAARAPPATSSSVVAMERAYLGGRAPRLADHPRLRQLRRHRLVARVLRPGRDAASRRSRSWTRPGRRASRRSTPPMRTAAAAARRTSASGSARRRRRPRRDRAHDEDVQPDGRGRGSRPRAGARASGSSRRACGGSASSASTCTSRTTGIPTSRSPRSPACFDELVAAGKIGAYGAEQRRRRAAPRGARAPARFAGSRTRTRCSTARPRTRCCRSARSTGSASRRSARSRAAGSPASTAATSRRPTGSRMTMRPGPYEHLRDDRVFDALEELERARRPGDARARVAARRRARLGRRRPAPPGAPRAGARRADASPRSGRRNELSALFASAPHPS